MSKYTTVRLNVRLHVQDFSFKNNCINGVVLPLFVSGIIHSLRTDYIMTYIVRAQAIFCAQAI